MRFDLLPMEYATELLNLLDSAAPLSNEEMFGVFKQETGKDIKRVFESLEETPLATASFAQVYKGTYNGSTVAIKIQKPKVKREIRADIMALSLIVPLLNATGILKAVSIDEVFDQLKDWLEEELDYYTEAKNTETIYHHAQIHNLKGVAIPKIYPEFTTEKVLVQEFLPGIQAKRLIESLRKQPEKTRQYLETRSIILEKVAEFFIRDLMRQYFIDGFFHADPHPANLMIFPENKIGYVDFGIIGRPTYDSFDFLRFIEAIARADSDEAADGIVGFADQRFREEIGDSLESDPTISVVYKKTLKFIKERVAIDLKPIVIHWHASTGDKTLSLRERSSAVAFFKIIKVLERYKVKFPPDVIAFIRTLLIIDMVCLKLTPDFSMVRAIKSFFEKTSLEEAQRQSLVHAAEMADLHDFDEFGPVEKITPEQIEMRQLWRKEKYSYAQEKFMGVVAALAEKYPELYNEIKNVL